MHVLNRTAVTSALILGCAGNPTDEVPTPRIVELALASKCPVAGMSLQQASVAWGRPDSIIGLPVDSVAYFRGPRKTVLELQLRGGTVVSWNVHGSVDPGIAQKQRVWSIQQAQGFKRRVAEYIGRRDLPPARAYALWRSCPQPGMSEADVTGSWGKPQERQVSNGRSQDIVLLYGFGVEGQHDRFVFRNDSLVSIEYIGWP